MKINTCLSSLFVLLSICGLAAVAQKLPQIQKGSLRAPADTKVDGKVTEWGQLQAYNKATEIYYTLANDNNNLYLVVKAINPQMIQKTMMTGINLTITQSKNKKRNDDVSLTFPLMKRDFYQRILRIAIARYSMESYQETKPEKDAALKARMLDTVMKRSNAQIASNVKLIGVTGIKEVTDGEISVYNDMGIKAKCLFDNQMALSYEIAIPLKYLNVGDKFAYHIVLAGADTRYIYTGKSRNQNIVGTTDFWGEYALVK